MMESNFPDEWKRNATREGRGVSGASNLGSAAAADLPPADEAKAKCAPVAPGRVADVPSSEFRVPEHAAHLPANFNPAFALALSGLGTGLPHFPVTTET